MIKKETNSNNFTKGQKMEKNLDCIDYVITRNYKASLYNVTEVDSYDCDYVICTRTLKELDKKYAYFYDLECAEFYLATVKIANL